jgi:hypothetical protein
MKNVLSQGSAKVRALKAIDTFLTNDHRLIGYSLRDHLLFVLGGPEHCLHSIYDTRNAVKALLNLVDHDNKEIHYTRAKDLLDNLLMACDSLIEDPYVEADLAKWVIEADDTDTIPAHLSDDYLNNIARQYEIALQMEALKKEERDIRSRDDKQRRKAA